MTPSDIKACEAHEYERAAKNEELERKIDAMLPDEIATVAKFPRTWIGNHEEDPTESLAKVFGHTATHWDNPAEIGRFVKGFLGHQIDGVLAARIERQE